MKDTKIFLGDKARSLVKEGIDEAANAIRVTLGPKGRNVITKQWNIDEVKSVNDGIYILRHITFKDPMKHIGALMLREIAEKTNMYAGDGTTTTAILAQEMYNEGVKYISLGANPVDLKEQILLARDKVLSELPKYTHKFIEQKMVEQVAMIAANNDIEIGKCISKIMKKIGRKAQITVEKSDVSKIENKIIKGIYWEDGYYSSRFIEGDISGKIQYEDCYILLTDSSLRYLDDFLPFFEKITEKEKKFDLSKDKMLIVVQDIDGDALTFFKQNFFTRNKNLNDGFFNVVVKAPDVGKDQFESLKDFAVMTGATIISKETGIGFKTADFKHLGFAKKVIVERNSTTIIGGRGKKSEIQKRIRGYKHELAQLRPMEKTIREKMEKRFARIFAGVGVIMAGGPTEIEVRDRMLRIEDAILATKYADEFGVCVGGGQTFINLAKILGNSFGEQIIKKAFESISKQIIRNSGIEPELIMPQLRNAPKNYGYNAKASQFQDLFKNGILDSARVIRKAIENSISLAALLISTDALAIETFEPDKEKKNEKPA